MSVSVIAFEIRVFVILYKYESQSKLWSQFSQDLKRAIVLYGEEHILPASHAKAMKFQTTTVCIY